MTIGSGAGPVGKEGSATRASGASRVALGMTVSRVMGFLREMTLAYFFGAGPHADVFRTALRGPNLLQNLLGEQTLSASFIPVYSRLLAAGRHEDAGRFAGGIFGLLLAGAAALSLLGVVLAAPIVGLIAPGYLADAAGVAAGQLEIDRFPLAVKAVRIIFPMTGVLVLSAWSLGVLNSHRRFFLPYMAPSLWNAAIIAALFLVADSVARSADGAVGGLAVAGADRLLIAACIGALAGGLLQFVVQLPAVARVVSGFRLAFSIEVVGVREALRAFAPLAASRGAVQLSSYLDLLLASFLAAGAVGALGWASTLYLLPISLFGMSVAAAELPEIARTARQADSSELLERLAVALRQMTFFTVPTALGYLVFGFLIVGGLFRRGHFGRPDNWLVYLVLCGYTMGLVSSTASRLLANAFYALGRTKVPARIAVERVLLSAALGVGLMLWLDRYEVGALMGFRGEGRSLYLGGVGLALGAGVSSWYELYRLRVALGRLVGLLPRPGSRELILVSVAAISCIPALGIWGLVQGWPQLLTVGVVLPTYAAGFLVLARWLGVSELGRWLASFRRRS